MTSHSNSNAQQFPKSYYKVAIALGIDTTLENMYKIEAFAKGVDNRTAREVEDFFGAESVMGFTSDDE